MPNYKFKCLDCGHKFQKLLPAAHEAQKCLECGHSETQKLLEAPGIHFKGSGFYATDSKKSDSAIIPDSKSESKAENPAPVEIKSEKKVDSPSSNAD